MAHKTYNRVRRFLKHSVLYLLPILLFDNTIGCSVNTDYVKVPIFPDFPTIYSDFMLIRQFDQVKSQPSHRLNTIL